MPGPGHLDRRAAAGLGGFSDVARHGGRKGRAVGGGTDTGALSGVEVPLNRYAERVDGGQKIVNRGIE